jgi:phospholipase/carboxylesterase
MTAERPIPDPSTRHLAGYRAGTGMRLGPDPSSAAAVVVAVHGRALSAAYMVEHLVSRLALEEDDRVAWILPEADGATWYPLGFLAPLADNQPSLDDALSVMAAIEAELSGVDPTKVIWLGYSQGGCVVAEHVARHPRRWGAIAILTGGMVGPADHPLTIAGSLEGTPTYFSNSDADEWVPLWRTEATADAFRSATADVTVDVFAGRPHEIGDGEIARVRALIEAVMS